MGVVFIVILRVARDDTREPQGDDAALQPTRARSQNRIEYDKPTRLAPGVWMTGPVPRTYPEKNWSVSGQLRTASGLAEDTVPEDSSIVVQTAPGLVVVSGCGHAGIVNTLEYAQKAVQNTQVHAAIGGFHLFRATDEQLDWTAEKLRTFGLRNLMGAHCTGIDAVYGIRRRLGLGRGACVVGAVGDGTPAGRADPSASAVRAIDSR